MVEAMEVDGVKTEAVAAVDASDATDARAVALDKVTLLQESVDKMALSMFNALRLLPASAESGGSSREETVAAVRGVQRWCCVVPCGASTRVACIVSDARGAMPGRAQIRSLASDVLQMVKETDTLIDDLPGLDKMERCVACIKRLCFIVIRGDGLVLTLWSQRAARGAAPAADPERRGGTDAAPSRGRSRYRQDLTVHDRWLLCRVVCHDSYASGGGVAMRRAVDGPRARLTACDRREPAASPVRRTAGRRRLSLCRTSKDIARLAMRAFVERRGSRGPRVSVAAAGDHDDDHAHVVNESHFYWSKLIVSSPNFPFYWI
jgi:hypothetical protein